MSIPWTSQLISQPKWNSSTGHVLTLSTVYLDGIRRLCIEKENFVQDAIKEKGSKFKSVHNSSESAIKMGTKLKWLNYAEMYGVNERVDSWLLSDINFIKTHSISSWVWRSN